jgi:hypothetical protein
MTRLCVKYRRFVVCGSVLLATVALILIRTKFVANRARTAETAFRDFYSALSRGDRDQWRPYVAPELLNHFKRIRMDADPEIKVMFTQNIPPLLPEFQPRVNWCGSKVILIVAQGEIGVWGILMERPSSGAWKIRGRKYFVNDDFDFSY